MDSEKFLHGNGYFVCLLLFHVSAVTGISGCASLPEVSMPFQEKERTTLVTPSTRIATIREMAARVDELDATEQQRITDELVMQIRTEPDPIVRKAIQETIARFSAPLARSVLLAGLNDEDRDVRITCCRKLGERAEPETVPALRQVLQSDEQLDVKLAATDALGQIKGSESIAALAIAINDRDPALQYAAIGALQAVSGEDFGNDVQAWRKFAAGEQPEIAPAGVSLAEKVKSWSPF